MRVLIRADASPAIGSGHVARCLTLARALRAQGANVAFACRRLPGHRLADLQAEGFQVFELPAVYAGEQPGAGIEAALPWQADIAALATVLGEQSCFDWVLVDHYGLDHQWQRAARQWAPRIAAIDDLANRRHAVDLLLDQNFSGTAEAYAGLHDDTCRTLFGPRFALLREAFQRPARVILPRARRVLVNFGGFDAARQTHKAMLALAQLPELDVDFVAGNENPDWQAMQMLAVTRPNWRLHGYVADFAGLLGAADLCLGAGGGTSWERAALGVPSVCVSVAANQEANARLLAEAGAHLYLGRCEEVSVEQLRQALGLLVENPGLRHCLAERGRELVDGLGVQRVAAALFCAVLRWRPASFADARLLFEGRNAEAVRRWSRQSEPTGWQEHVQWLTGALGDPERLLLIAELLDGPVGMLRYDRQGEVAEVSIYLFAGRFGQGWGRALLEQGEGHLMRHWPEVKRLRAQVLAQNQVSLALFRGAGYEQGACEFTRVLKESLDD
ncbi:UDP-2,4-diacetamido-2,4,6-trideoxy-beta-L-altropyranose hydrolase [Pseudomonas sessilinigenes]|uniref:UDP-2,4-diacetamido-2,4, 6-trideoxy-beta-L-altropyranose hydrolase n=1 Tax=Pseudomonas sessilinigenes TaxID=658629 RepID=A0ABX8MT01_9PSED|nr:UDP-2,4-diacetamido-2,4,6-trideoxy-beta-L-altropyranose hydrolase [Pseudomonas sessilinigenes]AZC23393.1 Pseudaminic acid cytidylyltransferase [Pseudomonas sessilinigenes]QXH42394.1 UDP-2,4-diacetamido-2,4,6-trideoxy-beta-L-altropyranose hydrolase [Pseudomonas sessilinigenes]